MEALDFQVTTTVLDDGTWFVGLSGEADLYTTPSFARDLGRLVAGGVPRIVVDLSGATFVDCTLLTTLLRCSKGLNARGGKLAIVVDDHRIRKIFEITGLDRKLRLDRSLAAAVAGMTCSQTDVANPGGETRKLTIHVENVGQRRALTTFLRARGRSPHKVDEHSLVLALDEQEGPRLAGLVAAIEEWRGRARARRTVLELGGKTRILGVGYAHHAPGSSCRRRNDARDCVRGKPRTSRTRPQAAEKRFQRRSGVRRAGKRATAYGVSHGSEPHDHSAKGRQVHSPLLGNGA
jgi:anti-sigma B factor antagonist